MWYTKWVLYMWWESGLPKRATIFTSGCIFFKSVSVSVYYVAVRTIVLSRHLSNLARPVIIHDIIHGLIYVPSTPYCGFFGVSPNGNCAYVHWGSFYVQLKVSQTSHLIYVVLCAPRWCIRHLAVPGGNQFKYEPGATSLNFSDRADIDERTPYPVWD